MSFLNRMMASIGIGSAKVDTRLQSAQARAGEVLHGAVRVTGGNVSQNVDSIYLYLVTQYWKETDNGRVQNTATLHSLQVAAPFTINAAETREFPFEFKLPAGTPVTIGGTAVWLMTGLEITMAPDPSDQDRLQVLPHPHSQVVLDAIESLGFRLRKTSCEAARRFGRGLPLIQEFEFVPTSQFRRSLDELEVMLFPHENGVDVILEVDRRARGFVGMLEEALEADESRLRVDFDRNHLNEGVAAVAGYLSDVISRYSR